MSPKEELPTSVQSTTIADRKQYELSHCPYVDLLETSAQDSA